MSVARRRRTQSRAVPRPLKSKYQNITYSIFTSVLDGNVLNNGVNTFYPCVVVANITGTRKAKNFSLDVWCGRDFNNQDPATCFPFQFLLAYVPSGQNPQTLTISQQNQVVPSYNPPANIICSGTGISNGKTISVHTRLARNLNQGDNIFFIGRVVSTGRNIPAFWAVNINYSITM